MRNGRFFLWILLVAFGMIFLSEPSNAAAAAVYNAHGKRDPFVPLVTFTTRESSGLIGVEGVDEILIEGIVYDPKKGSIVIMNGSVLKEGEEVGNVKVTVIKPDGVTFLLNGIEQSKSMYQEENQDKR